MFCRLLLAVCIVTCRCFSDVYPHTTSQSKLKDIICVLVLSGMQKEDLDNQTLLKLQEHNVNTDTMFNNEQVRQDCYMHHLQRALNISRHICLNRTTTPQTMDQSKENSAVVINRTNLNAERTDELYKFIANKVTNRELNQADKGLRADFATDLYKRMSNLTPNSRRFNQVLNKSSKIGFKVDNSPNTKLIKTSISGPLTMYETIRNKTESATNTIKENMSMFDSDYDATSLIGKTEEHPYTQLFPKSINTTMDIIPLIPNLDVYIKTQIAKYLSETKRSEILYESPINRTKSENNITPLAQYTTIKTSTEMRTNDEINVNNGQVLTDMNSINVLTDNIKKLVLNHIRQENNPTSKPDIPPQITEATTESATEVDITTTPKEEVKSKDVKENIDPLTKLMELIERISKTTTTSQPLMRPVISFNASPQTQGNYAYKNEFNPYQSINDQTYDSQTYGVNSANTGVKQMFNRPNVPPETPVLSYPTNSQQQIPTQDIRSVPNQNQNPPIVIPRSIPDAKVPGDAVRGSNYVNPPYDNTKQQVVGQYDAGNQKPQNYNPFNAYTLTKPQVQQSPIQLSQPQYNPQPYVTSKPQANAFQVQQANAFQVQQANSFQAPLANTFQAPLANAFQAPQVASFVLPFNQQAYEPNPAAQVSPSKQYSDSASQTFDFKHKVQQPQQRSNYWLPPAVSFDRYHTIKQPTVTKIQTNIAEIPPLRVIASGQPIFQNIIVPKPSELKPKWKPQESVPKIHRSKNPSDTSEQWRRIKDQIEMNIEDMEPQHETYSPQLDTLWHYNKDHYGNAARYHMQLENQDSPPAPPEPEHTRVASRQQMPYAHNHIFADSHIQKLMKSQQRISDILEHVLTLNKMLDDSSSQVVTS